ncbi:MAG: zinc-ribbon domain-containing protein [Rhodospirillales bacterium]
MIVVCPNCAAHYGIARDTFGQNARIVRCSACDFEWEAAPGDVEASDVDQAAEASPVDDGEQGAITPDIDESRFGEGLGDTTFDEMRPAELEQTVAAVEPVAPAWKGGISPAAGELSDREERGFDDERANEPDLAIEEAVEFSDLDVDSAAMSEPIDIAAEVEDDSSLPVRDADDSVPAQPKRPKRRLLMATGGAAALALSLGILVAAEGPIIRAFPGAAGVYSLFGLAPAPPGAGLDIRDVSSSREWSGSEDVLIVAGTVANVATGPRGLPPLRVTLFDGDRSEIQAVVVQPAKPTLAEGESVPFMARIPSPAVSARRVVVSFQLSAAEHG